MKWWMKHEMKWPGENFPDPRIVDWTFLDKGDKHGEQVYILLTLEIPR